MSTAAFGPAGSVSRPDLADEALVASMAAGDAEALARLYQRHGRAILAYVVGRIGDDAIAEEILQDVMYSAWRSAGQFRGESRVLTWLLSMAHHQMVNRLRRHHVATVSLDAPAAPGEPGGRPLGSRLADQGETDTAARAFEEDDLQQAMRRLLPDQQVALELVFFHELSLAEAAQVLDVSIGTVKSRLHRAKVALRREMGEDIPDDAESVDDETHRRPAKSGAKAGRSDGARPGRHHPPTKRSDGK